MTAALRAPLRTLCRHDDAAWTPTAVPDIEVQEATHAGGKQLIEVPGYKFQAWATEAACHLAICAYNLCVDLQRRLGQPQRAQLTTLRWRLFFCAAIFSQAASMPSLKLAVATKKTRLVARPPAADSRS